MGEVINIYEKAGIRRRYEYKKSNAVCLIYKHNGTIATELAGNDPSHNGYLVREILTNQRAFNHIEKLAYFDEIQTLSQSRMVWSHNFYEWPGMDTSKRKIAIDSPLEFIKSNGLGKLFVTYRYCEDIIIHDIERNVYYTNVNRHGEFRIYGEGEAMINENREHLKMLGIPLYANEQIFRWLEKEFINSFI
ncbi:TPA: hypothetical protein ACWMJU_006091 [Pseudomonas aeruginosa]